MDNKFFKTLGNADNEVVVILPTGAGELSAYRLINLAQSAAMTEIGFCEACQVSEDFLMTTARSIDPHDREIAQDESVARHNLSMRHPKAVFSANELAVEMGWQEFTIISNDEDDGRFRISYVMAENGYHGFGIVAKQYENTELAFLMALKGHKEDDKDFDFPGEGVVYSPTVLEQNDVFGPTERPRG